MFYKNAIAYATTTAGASMMNTIFQFYYVKLFLDVYKVSQYWFNIAQLVYLVWNAVNDPLFGYILDYSRIPALKYRQLNILYGAPFYSVSFLIPWFPWTSTGEPEWLVGIHLIVTLCFFDGMLTFVLLAQSSLFAEISKQEEERQKVVKFSSVVSIIGSCSILICESIASDLTHPAKLQVICVITAILAWVLMTYTGLRTKTAVTRDSSSKIVGEGEDKKVPMITLIKQLLAERMFITFVVTNFCQILHMTFCGNFFGTFRDHLIGRDVFPPYIGSLIAGSAFMLPQVMVLLVGPLLAKFGSYRVIMWSFYLKVTLALTMFAIGRANFWMLALFMIIDNSLPNAVFSLFNLSLSDIIYHDQKQYGRSQPISSMTFGTNALITKPAQSIAPIFVVYILKQYGYKDSGSTRPPGTGDEDLKQAMFSLLCFIPFVLGSVQILVWKMYHKHS